MITEPARLAEISVDLGEISSRRDENFSYEHSSRLTGIDFLIYACAVQSYDFKTKENKLLRQNYLIT